MTRYNWRLPVGDWSGDGHENCVYYPCSSALPLNDVREAYFTTKENLPEHLCPENICSKYDENQIAILIHADIFNRSKIDLAEDPSENGEYVEPTIEVETDAFVDYIVWFINQGNPDVDVRRELSELDDMLPFYGFDSQERHISFMGYGLLGD